MFDEELVKTTKSPPHLSEIVQAKVMSVYDGDTCTIVYNINNNILSPFVVNLRLFGVDAPEKKTNNNLEKKASLLLTEYVSNKILYQIIIIFC